MLKEGKNRQGKELNPQQEKFCMEYIICNNATKAALSAGYRSSATSTQLLKLKKIQDRLTELRSATVTDDLVSVTYIINNLKEIIDRCLKPVPVMVWNNVSRTIEQERNDKGQLVYKFDSMGANKSIELLMRYKGMLDKGNIMKTNNIENQPAMSDDQFKQLINAALSGNEG